MGDAKKALRLLLSESEEEAEYLAEEVNRENIRRQETEAEITKEAVEIIEKDGLSKYPVIVVSKENWHQGVLGIVAARLSEMYERPAIVISEDSDEGVGSGRSFGDFSLFDALKKCEECLVRFGGHKLAAGLTVKSQNIALLREKLCEIFKISDGKSLPILNILSEINPSELLVSAVEELDYLKPYGTENPQPIFAFKKILLENIYPIGMGNHTRFKFSDGKGSIYAVSFGKSKENFAPLVGRYVSVAFTVNASLYQAQKTLTVKVVDIKPFGFSDEEYLSSLSFIDKIKSGKEFTKEDKERFLPSRNDLVMVYSYFSKNGYEGPVSSLPFILPLSYGKIYAAISAFLELNLISVYKKGPNTIIKTVENAKKVDIMSASVLKRLEEVADR
jgi:single-stranded-DNA-specific exonuclease